MSNIYFLEDSAKFRERLGQLVHEQRKTTRLFIDSLTPSQFVNWRKSNTDINKIDITKITKCPRKIKLFNNLKEIQRVIDLVYNKKEVPNTPIKLRLVA